MNISTSLLPKSVHTHYTHDPQSNLQKRYKQVNDGIFYVPVAKYWLMWENWYLHVKFLSHKKIIFA